MSIFELFYEIIGVLLGSAIVWAIAMFFKGLANIHIGRRYPHRDPNQPHCRNNPAPGHRRG